MTTSPVATTPALLDRQPRQARTAAAVYFALAAAGLVGTWYFNLTYTGSSYLGDWFANAAASSAAVDIIVVAVVASAFYLREGRTLGWRLPPAVLFVPLSLLVAVAFALPLFLGLRELALARTRAGDAGGT